jgi:hypothetical protein
MVPDFSRFYEINLPLRKLSRVVLPAPDAPMILKNWPGRTEPLTPSRIVLGSTSGFLPQHPAFGTVVILISFQEIWTGTLLGFDEEEGMSLAWSSDTLFEVSILSIIK